MSCLLLSVPAGNLDTQFSVLSPSNYLTRVNTDGTGMSNTAYCWLLEPYFLTSDCMGQSYVKADMIVAFVRWGKVRFFIQ